MTAPVPPDQDTPNAPVEETSAPENVSEAMRANPALQGTAATYLGDIGLGVRRSLTNAWMLTFTDLVALMLTFFVLLFAMSQVEQDRWQNMVQSLALKLDSLAQSANARAAIRYQKSQPNPSPGRDLDYLESIMAQLIASDPAMAHGVIRRLPDRLVLSIPSAELFDARTGGLLPAALQTVSAIGDILGRLNNVIEIAAHEAPTPDLTPRVSWETSLARADRIRLMLAEAGYKGPVVALGHGASRSSDLDGLVGASRRTAFESRLDIVIHDRSREGGG